MAINKKLRLKINLDLFIEDQENLISFPLILNTVEEFQKKLGVAISESERSIEFQDLDVEEFESLKSQIREKRK